MSNTEGWKYKRGKGLVQPENVWIDIETNKSLIRLREIKAMREVRNGKQTKIQDVNEKANSER